MHPNIEALNAIKYKINSINYNEYKLRRFEFIKLCEGYKTKVYQDITGHKSIGIGYNLDSKHASQEWYNIFGNIPDYNDIIKGKITLNHDEIIKSFDYNIANRENELKIIYKDIWNLLLNNQKLSLEDMYFNSPKLVNKNTKFYKYINNFYLNNDIGSYYKAYNEIIYYSNPKKNNGIQNRRLAEATMFKIY